MLLFVPGVSDLVQNDVGVSDLVQNDVPHESILNSSQIDGSLLGKPTEKHVKWKQPVSLNFIILLLVSFIDLLTIWDPILEVFWRILRAERDLKSIRLLE